MNPTFFKIPVSVGSVSLRVAKGHFATRNSHTNYFIDVTEQRSCLQTAEAVARQLAQRDIIRNTMVDTILCLDGTRVIGTCLAQELTQDGNRSINAGKEIYLLRENLSRDGKLIFRDNARFMLDGKNVLLMLASVTTAGRVKEVDRMPVVSLFNTDDLPSYASYRPDECPLCKMGQPLDAVIDKYGYDAL